MFELAKQSVKISHINSRLEVHGEDEILAVDVKMSADVPNTMLDVLSPGLRQAFYDKGQQADLDEDHLTVLRFPSLPGFEWAAGLEEAQFTIHTGRKADDKVFSADVNNLRLTPKDGGTVSITFRAQILPEPAEVGELTGLLGQKVKVTVKAAEVSDTPPLE